jgi:hypothetical protein
MIDIAIRIKSPRFSGIRSAALSVPILCTLQGEDLFSRWVVLNTKPLFVCNEALYGAKSKT